MKSFESPIMDITYFNVNDIVTCSGETASAKARSWITGSDKDGKNVALSNVIDFTTSTK